MSAPPNSDVLRQLNNIEYRLRDLKERLPYADGQAYYNDKREIQRMEQEHRALLKTLTLCPEQS